MAGEEPGGQSQSEARPRDAGGAAEEAGAGLPGHWFPLLLFGGLAALSLPLSMLGAPEPPTGIAVYAVTYPTVTQAMYLGGGAAAGPAPFPLGWYTAAVCLAGWHDLRQRVILPLFYPSGDHTVLLPAAVLLLAGLGAALATARQKLRSRPGKA